MAEFPFKIRKAVGGLPTTLESNAIYLVRVGTGLDFYLTDATGSQPYKVNVSASQIIDALTIDKGGTGATTQEQARSNLGFGSATVNNQAFDVVGNNLINRYSNFIFIQLNTTYNVTSNDAESILQVYENTVVMLSIF